MAMFDFLAAFWGGRHITSAATEIVHRCQDQVWSEVASRVLTMGEAEAKGYTRARSSTLIARHVDDLIRQRENLGAWAVEPLAEEASRQVAQVVWYRARRAKTAAEEMPLRRAA